jgi:Zn-dependent peptidase ImmA (M78 family)
MERTKTALRHLAASIREETGIGDDEPFDPYAWSSQNAVPFVAIQDIPGVEAEVRHLTGDRFGVWSGALINDGIGDVVFFDRSRPQARIRSDLTHEVAHVEAEHVLSAAWINEDGKCGLGDKGQEAEAAELAAAILVPHETAKLWGMRGWPAERLADKLGVSLRMASWRIDMSGGKQIARRAQAKRRA